MLGMCLYCISSLAQVSFTGSSASVSTDDDASPVVVDDALLITTTHSIDGARVSITSNFVSGDILSYNSALVPSGVTDPGSSTSGVLTFTGTASASDYQALLRSVTFTASANGSSNRVVEFYLGSTYLNTTNNHFYQYIPSTDISWTSARDGAASKNYFGLTGYLATITSADENQLVQGLIPTDDVNAAAWIGASDEYSLINATGATSYADQNASEGNFYWVTGPEAGTLFSSGNTNPVVASGQYMNWNSGEPNNWGSGEHYTEIKLSGGWNDDVVSGWNNVDGYIVEFVGLSGEPTLDVTHSRTVVVNPTILTTTSSSNYHAQNSSVVVDNALTLKSGGMITDARVTISGNFTTDDVLSYTGSLPSGVTASYNSSTGVLSFTGTAKPSDWQALFRTVTFVSTSPSSNDRTVSFSVGNMISGENGHFYEYVSGSNSSWTTARDAAAARTYMGLQGYLATITSQQENDLISQKLVADGWLGGSDEYSEINAATGTTTYADQSASEGNFFWVTGPEKGQPISYGNVTPVNATAGTYTNWYNGEPNNAGNEHYLEIYSTGAPGEWNDLPNSSLVGMVVEYGGLPTDPGIILSASRVLTNDFSVLPVQDLTFHLKEKGSNVIIDWAVYHEENVSHYDLLRSDKGNNFKKIGAVKALDNAGTTTYTYTDHNTLNGTNYYQIAVVDEDGKQTFSEVRSIIVKGKLQVYPSVFTNHFTVHQSYQTPSLLTITDASGAMLLQKIIRQGTTNIEAGFLTSGIYFVQISNGQRKEVFKIMKR